MLKFDQDYDPYKAFDIGNLFGWKFASG